MNRLIVLTFAAILALGVFAPMASASFDPMKAQSCNSVLDRAGNLHNVCMPAVCKMWSKGAQRGWNRVDCRAVHKSMLDLYLGN